MSSRKSYSKLFKAREDEGVVVVKGYF